MPTSLHVQLIGNICLRDADGVDRTPGGQKARGLIGLLALTPDHSRPRRWLEQKLWSDRSPEQASNSLRQVLMELRTALGPAADDLKADRQFVTLAPLATDLEQDPDGIRAALAAGYDLMQDVHLRDAAFNAWLADQRARLAGTAPITSSGWLPDAPAIPLVIRTALMPTERCSFVAAAMGESISKLVSDFINVDIFTQTESTTQIGPRDRGLILSVGASESADRLHFITTLESSRTGQVLWSRQAHSLTETTSDVLAGNLPSVIFEAAEAAINAMPRVVGDDPSPLRAEAMMARAVRAIFSFQEHQLRFADDLLRDAAAIVPSARAYAWRSILRQFMGVERTEKDRNRLRDEAELYSEKAMVVEPPNSLVLSLLSQVEIMLHDNLGAGAKLARDAIHMNPMNAFGYIAQAGTLLRQDRPKEAYDAADFGAGFAARSGYLHWWEMHKGLAATQMGDYETAISCFEAARARAPHFRAPLRHLIFLYLQRGQPENAQRALANLRRIEPDFSLDLIRDDPNYPAGTLRRAGLLSLPFTGIG
ncbi:MAG: tetratricopeptide repeat protein [Paracoccaceae bacterium]